MVNQVHKFGGSSLSSADRFKSVANIILTHAQAGDCVVVSAAGKTTDTLVKLWQSFQQQDTQAIADIILLISNHQSSLLEFAHVSRPPVSPHRLKGLRPNARRRLAQPFAQLLPKMIDEQRQIAFECRYCFSR